MTLKHRLLSGILLDASSDSAVEVYKERIRDSLKIYADPSFGLEGYSTGTPDASTAMNAFWASERLKFVPNGNYATASAVTAHPHPTVVIAENAQEDGIYMPLINVGRQRPVSGTQQYVFIRQDTTDRNDSTTVQIQRIVNSDISATNPNALRVYTEKNDSNTGTEWALSAVLDNHSNTAADGDTAVSGSAFKYGTASTFAGHLQAQEMFKYAAATDVTGLVGAELNVTAVGLDHPTANSSTGNRRGWDIIARTATGVTNWDTGTDNKGDGETGIGLHIRTDTASRSKGYFRNGMVISEGSGNTNPIATAIRIATNGGRSIYITGNVSGQHIEIGGNASYGMVMSGSYSSAALRIPTQTYIAMEATNTIKTAYGVVTNLWSFYNGSTERFAVNMSTGALRVNGLEVIAARDTGWAAMTGTANKNTVYDTSTVTLAQLAGRVMSMQAALTTHGLLGV